LAQTLTKNAWLLALCGVLEAIISVIFLIMQETDGPITFHAWNRTVTFLGMLAMAAGACAIVAGIWRSTKHGPWLLALNGLALFALGLIYYRFVRFGISFRTIAFLIIVMAMSTGILELITARRLRHRVVGEWFFRAAGAVSIGLVLVFFVYGFGWIKLAPGSHTDLLWLGSYFAFSAICMLALAMHLRGRSLPEPGQNEALPRLGTPRHAH
jgi:uncharacterized membrane protein HdeD (DUF308 family)